MENNEDIKCGTPEGTQDDTLQPIENNGGEQPVQEARETEPLQEAPSYYGQPSAQEAAPQQPSAPYQAAPQQTYAAQPQQPNYQTPYGTPNGQPEPQPWVYRSGEGNYRASQPRRRRIWPAVLTTAVCCILIGALLGGIFLPLLTNRNNKDTAAAVLPSATEQPVMESREEKENAPSDPVSSGTTEEAEGEGQDPDFTFTDNDTLSYVTSGSLADMAEAVSPSIVGILNLQYISASSYYGYGYGYNNTQKDSEPTLQEAGSGSGVIISEDGYIVTNAHVVEGQDALKVLIDGEEIDAVLVGSDTVTDLAVVKIDRTGLSAATLGDSDKVRVGELAVAIGNPLGSDLAGTVTMGIISATDRTIEVDNQYIDVLQTDAAINPGNSGGALVDQNGLVVGITSAKTVLAGYDSSGNAISAEGIGYAIPINNAKPVIEQLIRTGRVPRPALGITIQFVTNRLDETQTGFLVTTVTPGSCAEKAGLKVNDVIREFNGQACKSISEFKKLLMECEVGDTITLTVERNDQTLEIQVTLMDSSDLNTSEEGDSSSEWSIPGYGGYNPFG